MIGKTVNGFTIKELIGSGGMADVYYAENKLKRNAAIKVLKKKYSNDPSVRHRFLKEAEIMVSLNHVNVTKVLDFDEIDEQPAIIMEFLEGKTFKDLFNDRKLTDHQLKNIFDQTVSGLLAAHAKGIIHRDIKPSNIFITHEGIVKVMDFGIAKLKDDIGHTSTGQTLGTVIYMSPEQVLDPKRIDKKSDAYSLAVTFYHALTGKPPYDIGSTSDYQVQTKIVQEPLDLSLLPSDWKQVLSVFLEKNPGTRKSITTFDEVLNLKQFDIQEGAGSIHKGSEDDTTTIDTAEKIILAGKKETTVQKEKKASSSSNNQDRPNGIGKKWTKKIVIIPGIFLFILLSGILIFVIGKPKSSQCEDIEKELTQVMRGDDTLKVLILLDSISGCKPKIKEEYQEKRDEILRKLTQNITLLVSQNRCEEARIVYSKYSKWLEKDIMLPCEKGHNNSEGKKEVDQKGQSDLAALESLLKENSPNSLLTAKIRIDEILKTKKFSSGTVKELQNRIDHAIAVKKNQFYKNALDEVERFKKEPASLTDKMQYLDKAQNAIKEAIKLDPDEQKFLKLKNYIQQQMDIILDETF